MSLTFNCRRWSNYLLDVDLIEENKLVRCQKKKLLFFVPVRYMPHFHILSFVINKQYEEGEMSRVVVFVYVFAFNFSLTLFTM